MQLLSIGQSFQPALSALWGSGGGQSSNPGTLQAHAIQACLGIIVALGVAYALTRIVSFAVKLVVMVGLILVVWRMAMMVLYGETFLPRWGAQPPPPPWYQRISLPSWPSLNFGWPSWSSPSAYYEAPNPGIYQPWMYPVPSEPSPPTGYNAPGWSRPVDSSHPAFDARGGVPMQP